jgi:O-antigen/teichoic acid export membrane protein
MRRDIASAYLSVGARIGGLLLVSAAVYRSLGLEAFAIFNLIRSTVGLLNYTGLGLAPAMVRMLAAASAPRAALPVHVDEPVAPSGRQILSYATPSPLTNSAALIYFSGEAVAGALALIGFAGVVAYAATAPDLHNLAPGVATDAAKLAAGLGAATVLRLLSEPQGAVLQIGGWLALDNALLAAVEVVSVVLAGLALAGGMPLGAVGVSYALCNGALIVARTVAARRRAPAVTRSKRLKSDWQTQKALLAYGLLVTLAQLADFLYSPTDFILINRLLSLADVATYAPAVQLDAGLLTLVTGLGAVLLPRSAVAHGAGDTQRVRRYYLRGTLASTALLLAAALAVWALAPWLLRLWLGHDMPPTRAILPLVLIHTVVGGSGAVGRSVLLGMGKVRPFTASVLVAGVANVVLSYVFVRYFGMGLRGIVLGTIVAVVARAGLWTPWYVLRTLKRASAGGDDVTAVATPAASGPTSPTSG